MLKSTIAFFNNNKTIAAIIVVLALAVVVFPRFNRQDIGFVSSFTGTAPYELNCDNESYLRMTEYFQGNGDLFRVSAPFCFRPLGPYLASFLPFDAFTSLNLLNALAILLCAPLTFAIAKRFGFSYGVATLGVLLHFVSFPVFFYCTSGFVDPLSILFIYLFIWARVCRQNWLLLVLYMVSAWAKETTIMITGYLLIDIYFSKYSTKRNDYITVVLGSILFVGEIFLIRSIFANPGVQMAWVPDSSALYTNLTRAKTYLTFIMSFGLTGLISVVLLWRDKALVANKGLISYYIGILSSIALFAYAIVSAYSDGRFMWPGIPFGVVLSMFFMDTRNKIR